MTPEGYNIIKNELAGLNPEITPVPEPGEDVRHDIYFKLRTLQDASKVLEILKDAKLRTDTLEAIKPNSRPVLYMRGSDISRKQPLLWFEDLASAAPHRDESLDPF